MTSKLVSSLLLRENLTPLLARREAGERPSDRPALEILARAEILALGAAAQLVRLRECGDEARIYVPTAPPPSEGVIVISSDESTRGTAFLRRIAILRLTGAIGQRIVVDFGSLGLEIAQVALSFGATDLAGPIAGRRGLPMLESEEQKALVKRGELAAYVERAGLRPVFVASDSLSRHSSVSSPSRPHVDS